ncbi:MAG TPA: hypothetical protein VF506_08405 [Streptosporangiaceae bacterium]
MASRGIVAADTAPTFGAELAAHHIGGAAKILPVAFLVIVATVALYGLTAVPVARRLGVTRPARSCPLLVGGDQWVIDLARVLRSAGLRVVMWAPDEDQWTRIKHAGIELAPREQIASAVGQGADLEGATAVFMLTGEDHFNALAAATVAGNASTPVYRLAPSHGEVGQNSAGEILFASRLTHSALTDRYTVGSRIATQVFDGGIPRPLTCRS